MTLHSNAKQEEPTTELPTTVSESDVKEDVQRDADEEEEIKKWLAATYERSKQKPMKEPLTAPWGLPISDADVEKLKRGLRARNMDDKWEILIEDPDEYGNISFHILRSMLQEDCYIFHIIPKSSNDNSTSAIIQSITWEGNKAGLQCGAEQAKIEAVIVSRSQLHCEFEALPHYPSSMMWAKTAYERVAAE